MTNLKIALIGNPNVGKTSLFNALTGMNQRVGNYPGITVERKVGNFSLNNQTQATIIDLPGVYSINPTSTDEEVALQVFFDQTNKDYPDVVVVVAEAENLKRNLLLFLQIRDLGFPTLLCINMADQMQKKGISIDIPALEKKLNTKIVLTSTRQQEGIDQLKSEILALVNAPTTSPFDIKTINPEYFSAIEKNFPTIPPFKVWMALTQNFFSTEIPLDKIEHFRQNHSIDVKKIQHKEVVKRYQFINEVLKKTYTLDTTKETDVRMKLDRIFTHKIFGYVQFIIILGVIFGAVFELAKFPMDFIEGSFEDLSNWVLDTFPKGKLTDLIANGVLMGLSGVLMFVPQISILFLLIAILEDSGYMSRMVFLMDKIMHPFGLNGKSVIPLVSGTACAIPAIMAARNIENPKERFITMLITPFTTCSARIPIYIIIISVIIPQTYIAGFIPLQALVMVGMYAVGFVVAMLAGKLLSKLLKYKQESYFIIEMPTYKVPIFKNVLLTVYEKVLSYITNAGKIILALSIILWFLGSHGGENYNNAEEIVTQSEAAQTMDKEELEFAIAKYESENSYIGKIGQAIQPIFAPLGYDWKTSIGILTSFAARETFVGTLSTLYNLGDDFEEQETQIIERMKNEKRPDGTPVFGLATGLSLLMFYAFAMQCTSTIAITKKELNSWKWTAYQMFGMTIFAYIMALLVYQLVK